VLAPLLGMAILAAVAGCQGSGAATPVVTPAPSATGATGPATSAGPTPTSAAAAAQAVIDGLRAFAADEGQTYRVSITGDSRHTTDILAVEGTLDVSGDDAAITARFRFPGQGTGRTDYRRVGADDWIRFDRGTWRVLRGVAAGDVVDPLAGARDDGKLQYLGPVSGKPDRFTVELDGMVLHPVLIPAGNLTDEQVLTTTLQVVTDATGRPVSGTWAFRGTGRVSGQLQAVEIDLELVFSNIGKPVSIKAP
jgi:hypothetical protein